MTILLKCLLLIVIQYCHGSEEEDWRNFNFIETLSEEKLVFTNILYSNGEHTPEGPYKKDPYRNSSYWPAGWGQLTNNGKRQHYELGKWLKQRYGDLMRGGRYNPNSIYVRSTDKDRTLMSALSNLAGMFYPTPAERWSDINWQPVPVHTIPMELDKLLGMGHPCPKYQEQWKAFYNSGMVKELNRKNQGLYDYLTKHIGVQIDNPIKVWHLYSLLQIQKLNNYKLPEWTNQVFPGNMYNLSTFGLKMPVFTKPLKRLFGGPLLKEIIEKMKAKRSGQLPPDRNIFVYSAEETTIAALLETMGIFENHIPPFAATLMIEGLREESKFYVSVYYKQSGEKPTELIIPGCYKLCPLERFESILSEVIPKNWDMECKI